MEGFGAHFVNQPGAAFAGTASQFGVRGQFELLQAVTVVNGFGVNGRINQTAGTIDNAACFIASASKSGGTLTLIKGLDSQITDGLGTASWNIFAQGTAPNHFIGDVRIGTQSSNNAMLVVTRSTSDNAATQRAQYTSLTVSSVGGTNALRGTDTQLLTTSSYTGTGTLTAAAAEVINNVAATISVCNAVLGFYTQTNASAVANSVNCITADVNVTAGTVTDLRGFRGLIQSGDATNAWNLFCDGTARNHLQGDLLVGTATPSAGAEKLQVSGALSISSATMIRTYTAFTNGAGAGAGTLTNAPAAGNPTKWIPVNDNGTTRHIPAW